MIIFVQWYQLPHPPMVSVIVVYINKATNAGSQLLYVIYNTCKAKRDRRPRVRSTPIDNTYVQVNNECSLLC